MIGAYYSSSALERISGLGAQPTTMNDEATAAILTVVKQLSPLAIVIPWATLDESTGKWVDSTPEFRYQLYAVTAQLLDSAQRVAFGQPVGFVAVVDSVIHPRPSDLFDGTPWEYFETDGVFEEGDTAEPPRIKWLYWGKLRDEGDVSGTASKLEAQVKAQGGQLVYPVNLPVTGLRARPTTLFADALQQQFHVAPSANAAAATPLIPPSPPTTAAVATQPATWGKYVLVAAIVGVSGYVVYRVVRRK